MGTAEGGMQEPPPDDARPDVPAPDAPAPDASGPDEATPAEPSPRVSRWTEFKSGEWPVLPRIDLTDAYAAVRRRGRALRRRRIISTTVAAIVLGGLLTVVSFYYVSTIPLPDALDLPATTTVYYSDGTTVMARLGSQSRTIVNIDGLPAYVRDAVLAAEDPGFFVDSATLISRQYARAAGAAKSGTPAGEARLLVMTWKLEDTYSKKQILGFYLNTVYFGRGAFGIEAAAKAYFDKPAATLTRSEAITLAGLIASPGDGRYDPTVDPTGARIRFGQVTTQMVVMGTLDQQTADGLSVPRVEEYDPALFESDLDRPTGLAVSQVLAELRQSEEFRGKAPGFIENGGYSIVTTLDARAQALLERTADETVAGSVMTGQPGNLQAAAVVVEPGTGRVIAYYGGHDGTGADYAGFYVTAGNRSAGFGAHPPGQSFGVYTLTAAVQAGISVKTTWSAPESKEVPGLGMVRDVTGPPCQPNCSLVDATTGSLNIPYASLAARLGPAPLIDAARSAGIDSMWVPATASAPQRRYDVAATTAASLTPEPFGLQVGQGDYPVTVVDQANAMATYAGGGRRARAHFVRTVTKSFASYYAEPRETEQALRPEVVDDVTWVLAQNPAGQLADGRASAVRTGSGRLRTSVLETANAWTIGYTANLAMAVWIGNEEIELPLKDAQGARVTGDTLPAAIYRGFMSPIHATLGLPQLEFGQPTFAGDAAAGDGAR